MSKLYDMSKGKYLVGDPCYFFTDKDNSEWLRFLTYNNFEEGPGGKGNLVGTDIEIVVFGTAYGDGSYKDDFNHSYDVDSGLIGIIPFQEGSDVTSGMNLVDFEKDFECYNDKGTLHFGDIVIDTKEDTEYDDFNDEGVLFDDE